MVAILFSQEEEQQVEEEEAVFIGFMEAPNILTNKKQTFKDLKKEREKMRRKKSKGVMGFVRSEWWRVLEVPQVPNHSQKKNKTKQKKNGNHGE